MTNNETQADILAEMRTFGDRCDRRPFSWQMVAGMFTRLADRLEAAAKRERGALVAEAEAAKDARNRVAVRLGVQYAERCSECKAKSGSAAMREALEAVREAFDSNDFGAIGDHPRSDVLDMVDAVRRKVEDALSAPVRNCDRYRTEKEAEAAFDRFCAKARDGECKPWKCPLKSTGGKYCYVAWLLGTEGGAE